MVVLMSESTDPESERDDPGVPDGEGTDRSARTEDAVQRFEFDFAKRYRPMLAAIGVRPANSYVTLSSQEMVARFGRWTCKSPVDNIKCVHLTGPYLAVKAIGTRMSAADTGLTFGTNTVGGVCVCFRRPVPGFDALGNLRHEALTVTVADREGFIAAIQAVATLDEEDELQDDEG